MEKLLAIITIIQRAGGKRALLRLFSRLIIVIALMIITAIMVSAFLIGTLMAMYTALISSAMTPLLALLYIGCAALFIIITLIAVIVSLLKGLHRHSKKASLTDMFDAFTDGLMAE